MKYQPTCADCAPFVGHNFDYIKSKSLMIGDASGKEGQFSDSDKRCAENFGIDYFDVEDFKQYVELNKCNTKL